MNKTHPLVLLVGLHTCLVVFATMLFSGCAPQTETVAKDDVIIIDSHERIFLNCEMVQLNNLREVLEVDDHSVLTLAASEFINVDTFTLVLDIVREHRVITNINLATVPNENLNDASCPDASIQFSQKRKTDSEYEKAIVGVWSALYEEDDYRLYGETEYKPDGTAEGRGESCSADVCEIIEFTTTWSIEDGVLTSVDVTSNDGTPAGTTYIDRIDFVSPGILVLIGVESGNKQIRRKVTRPKMLSR